MSKSKYNEFFNIGGGVAACKNCDYKHPYKPGDPTTSLNSHLRNHHKDLHEKLQNSDGKKKKAIEDANAKLQKQQQTMKRAFPSLGVQEESDEPSSSKKNKDEITQPRIDKALSLFD